MNQTINNVIVCRKVKLNLQNVCTKRMRLINIFLFFKQTLQFKFKTGWTSDWRYKTGMYGLIFLIFIYKSKMASHEHCCWQWYCYTKYCRSLTSTSWRRGAIIGIWCKPDINHPTAQSVCNYTYWEVSQIIINNFE